MKIHHVGYAVNNINKAREKFIQLGYIEEQAVVVDKIRNVEILFMINGQERIELIAALEGKTAVDNVLKKSGPSPYHICYITKNLNETIQRMRKEGYLIIEQPQFAPAILNKKVAFLYHKEIGILELVEE